MRQILKRWLHREAQGVRRRGRVDEYELLKDLGREQLEKLQKKGLSIRVVAT